MVLPAHGPWLPDDASSLMARNAEVTRLEQLWSTCRRQKQPSCSIAPSSSTCCHSPWARYADLPATFLGAVVAHTPVAGACDARLPHLLLVCVCIKPEHHG